MFGAFLAAVFLYIALWSIVLTGWGRALELSQRSLHLLLKPFQKAQLKHKSIVGAMMQEVKITPPKVSDNISFHMRNKKVRTRSPGLPPVASSELFARFLF